MSIEAFLGISLVLAGIVFVVWSNARPQQGGAVPEDKPKEDKPANDAVDLADLADKIEPVLEKAAHPSDIIANPLFERAVAALASDNYTIQQVSNYALGANWVLSCIGYEALSYREDSAETVDRALNTVNNTYAWPLFFLLRFIEARATEPVAARILCCVQYWWSNNTAIVSCVGEYLDRCIKAGEKIEFGQPYIDMDSDDKEEVGKFINALPPALKKELNDRLKQHEGEAVDQKFLTSVGEILTKASLGEPVFDTGQIASLKADMLGELDTASPRSILIVGPSGVGKTALRRAFGRELLAAGWRLFKTSAANIIADKVYIGQIEGQVRKLSQNASVAKRIAVYVDNLAELSEFGATNSKKSSVLDQLWPAIESRRMFFVSETSASGLQTLLRQFPSLPTALKVIQMHPVEDDVAADLAEKLLDQLCGEMPSAQRGAVVAETLQLAQQYLSHKSMPGSVLSLLELAVLRGQREGNITPQRAHVLGALSQISGLPQEVLDDKQQLDIDGIGRMFRESVIGQDEAVDCLVERIAMLKAGLTDPSRPVGVFLFAGPTGTGKTEIAKTLAEILFGSPEQMTRLDMSEYQDPDSVWRLLGNSDREASSGSLVNRIRERPFSVILLDEFEKAHPKVWDVFLQVFDDGRLSDSRGDVADFRHAIIILTSNLGATISNEAGVGFRSTTGGFSPADVLRTVNRTFRREFINRLDRVVVFNPLNREVMRAILHKELEKALGRRGLRTKQWAVEWEDSAVEFLLSEGFTPDLGARPLRRAIEKHLLAPLSITMVQNRVPDGEQFLFVRSNGEALQVEFIDPDAESEGVETAKDTDTVLVGAPDLHGLILSAGAHKHAAAFLTQEMDEVVTRVAGDHWAAGKAGQLAELNSDGFWGREDKYRVLDRIELIDRIDSAASVLGSLSERLQRHPTNPKLIESIANRLYVVREGLKDLDLERPTQAYLGLRLVTKDAHLDGADLFLQNLVDMYTSWGRARGMRLKELDATSSRYETLFAVSGFGSYGILTDESGLHVFEVPTSNNRFDRIRARVQVAPIPVEVTKKLVNRGSAATKNLDDLADKVEIVRRYREQPSPLARDSRRQWRTGRLDQVFSGNFDIIG